MHLYVVLYWEFLIVQLHVLVKRPQLWFMFEYRNLTILVCVSKDLDNPFAIKLLMDNSPTK